MPILERRPDKCFDRFRDHVSGLVSAILNPAAPLRLDGSGNKRKLSFQQGGPTTIPLQTRFGRLHFYLGQSLQAVPTGTKYRLRTVDYWYRLQERPGLTEKALIRWEYKSALRASRPLQCRNHIQIQTQLALTSGNSLDLNKLHIPTNWVTIEEIMRFLIADLGVNPQCGIDWPNRLKKSEKSFYEDFTSKRYKS